ncbi:MAG: helix-turn-helix domain-containing protein [Solirubrobacterales bacterium]
MSNRSDEEDLLVALRHPLRRRILRRMADGEEASPRGLSSDLRETLSSVSYHVRVLRDCSAITLTRTAPVRGSVQHFYRNAVVATWARQILGLEDGAPGDPPGGDGPEPGQPHA